MSTQPNVVQGSAVLNLRLDAGLKAELMRLAAAENRSASEVVRGLIEARVRELEEAQMRAEIQRQCQLLDQSEDEKEVLRWIEEEILPEAWQ